MLLSEQIKALAKDHDLSTISINYHSFDPETPFTAYAHWVEGGVGRCTSAHGGAPEYAIVKAIEQAHAMRSKAVAEIEPITVEIA